MSQPRSPTAQSVIFRDVDTLDMQTRALASHVKLKMAAFLSLTISNVTHNGCTLPVSHTARRWALTDNGRDFARGGLSCFPRQQKHHTSREIHSEYHPRCDHVLSSYAEF